MKNHNDFPDNPLIEFVMSAMNCNNLNELLILDKNSFKVELTEKWITEKPILISEFKYLFDDEFVKSNGFPMKTVKFIVNPSWLFSDAQLKKKFVKQLGEFLGFPIYTYIPSINDKIPDAIDRAWCFDSSDKENPPKAIRFGDYLKAAYYRDFATEYENEFYYKNFEKTTKITFTVRRENNIDTCYDERVLLSE